MGSRKIRFRGFLIPMSEKEAQAERFVGIDDRQMKEDMLCLRHDPDIKGQAPCVKGVHTSSAAEKIPGLCRRCRTVRVAAVFFLY